MLVELFLAKKYMKVHNSALSLISMTSIIGVTLGVAVLLIVLAVMTGFTDLMKSKLIETQSHFQIRSRFRGGMENADELVNIVKSCGANATPVIQSPMLVQYRGNRLDSQVYVMAGNVSAIREHLTFMQNLRYGRLSLERKEAIISYAMAQRWRIGVGDKILLHSANRLTSLVTIKQGGGIELNSDSSAYLPAEFNVVGIYSAGKYDFDKVMMFIGLDDAAELLDLPWGGATNIFGWGDNPFKQDRLINAIRSKLPSDCVITTWEDDNSALLNVLAVEKRMMFFLLIFIVLVAAFSITNSLIISVYRKTREIGILKSIGFTDGMVMRIFLLQGFITGLVGSIAGTILGYLVIVFRNKILHAASAITGMDLFPKEFYYFSELPAKVEWVDVTFVVVASIVLCTIGAIIPAIRAARLEPAKALRYE